jgi:hypothetical protein
MSTGTAITTTIRLFGLRGRFNSIDPTSSNCSRQESRLVFSQQRVGSLYCGCQAAVPYNFLVSEWRRPCLLLPLLVGLRPSSSAAFPSSGRQWLPLLGPPKRRAILLHCVSGTARRGIMATFYSRQCRLPTLGSVSIRIAAFYDYSLSRSAVVLVAYGFRMIS